MDDFNVKKESNTRNVSMQNGQDVAPISDMNVTRAPKIVPDVGLDLLANQKLKLGSQSSMSDTEDRHKAIPTHDDDESRFDTLNINNGRIPFTAPRNVHDVDQLSVSDNDDDDDLDNDNLSVVSSGSETTSIYTADSSHHESSRPSHTSPSTPPPVQQPTFEDIQAEKQNLLSKIKMMEERYGMIPTKRYTIMSNVEDMRSEYHTMKRQRGVEKAIKFGRKAMLATISGIEFLNTKFNPIGAKLEGWSEAFADEVNDYDEIFEQLHDKYSDSLDVPPEISLLMGVAGSGVQYHIKKSLFSSNMPSLNQVLASNPDIMRSVASAAGNSMRMNRQQDNTPAPPVYTPSNTTRRQPSGPVNMGGNPMSRPSGVDDILSEINTGNVRDNRFETLSSASESTMLTRPGEKSQGRSARRQKRMMQL